MNPKLYHCRVFFPEDLAYPDSRDKLCLTYSKHALEEAEREPRSDFRHLLPRTIKPEEWELIEAEAVGTLVTKCLFQKPVAGWLLSLVVRRRGPNEWLVVTNWLNQESDFHGTLNKSRYEQPDGSRGYTSPIELTAAWGTATETSTL